MGITRRSVTEMQFRGLLQKTMEMDNEHWRKVHFYEHLMKLHIEVKDVPGKFPVRNLFRVSPMCCGMYEMQQVTVVLLGIAKKLKHVFPGISADDRVYYDKSMKELSGLMENLKENPSHLEEIMKKRREIV